MGVVDLATKHACRVGPAIFTPSPSLAAKLIDFWYPERPYFAEICSLAAVKPEGRACQITKTLRYEYCLDKTL